MFVACVNQIPEPEGEQSEGYHILGNVPSNDELMGNDAVSDIHDFVEIYVFGIGRADAILITTENHAVMIDTGENRHGVHIARTLMSRNIFTLDYLIITHLDGDHVGGAHTLIRNMMVHNVIVPNYGRESRSVERFESAMLHSSTERHILTETISFTLDDAEFVIYPSQLEFFFFAREEDDEDDYTRDEDAPNENNFSIIVTVSHRENNLMFTGDAMASRLGEVLQVEEITAIDFDFLKLPHHGRHNRRSIEFLNTVNPRYAVSTCCVVRPIDRRVLASLENIGTEVFFTRHGGVHVTSDGYSLTVSQ